MAPYRTASALTFQAFWHPVMARQYRLAHPFSDYDTFAGMTPDDLDPFLMSVREKGYCAPPAGDHAIRLGIPVYDHQNTIKGVIGLYFSENSATDEPSEDAIGKIMLERYNSLLPT